MISKKKKKEGHEILEMSGFWNIDLEILANINEHRGDRNSTRNHKCLHKHSRVELAGNIIQALKRLCYKMEKNCNQGLYQYC